MVNIDFVPNDYVQQRESKRANLLYLMLFLLFMGAIVVTFSTIKMRQKQIQKDISAIDARIATAQEQFKLLEQIQNRYSSMLKTLSLTAGLFEPVPKSLLLACLTNNLPNGVSLVELKIVEKEVKGLCGSSQYQQASTADKADSAKGKVFQTRLEIGGIAPSDIEVANYIAKLSESILFDGVTLEESKEHKIKDAKFRRFKLSAFLKSNIHLTKEDINEIRFKQGAEI